ncbi:NFACT family protein, partial [Ferroglobus sp.]|uniref:NFACT family protein n=1 Tax=Ferroglobus sp. TaxID=2614230 RepID=UPI0025C23B2A
MRQMSSIDIRAVLNELNIEGMRVDKIYHYPPNEFRIKLRGKGRVDVLVEAGKRFHATEFPKESPRFPSAVAMLLRKHLEGAKVEGVYQHDFDRIVVVEFSRGGERKIIVSELFGKGNLLLLDEDFKVILSVNPSYKVGDVYGFPEKRLTPFDVKSVKDLEEILDEKEVVKTLATKLGLGGLYAEEILERAGVNKKKPGNELEKDEVRRIFEEMR